MALSKNKVKLLVAVFVTFVAFALLLPNVFPQANASLNVEVSGDHVRIFVGDMGGAIPVGYSGRRSSFLRQLADDDPNGVYSAVVPLDNYYAEAEINELIVANDLQVERVYLWAPGETGKVALGVADNNIAEAKEKFVAKMADPDNPELMRDLERLTNGEFKIYALSIEGTAQELEYLQGAIPQFAAVDVEYNPDAEQYAMQRGKTFEYIELPSKPDGAL